MVSVLAIREQGHVWIVLYEPGGVEEALDVFCRWSAEPEPGVPGISEDIIERLVDEVT